MLRQIYGGRVRSGPWEHAHQSANFILVCLCVRLTDWLPFSSGIVIQARLLLSSHPLSFCLDYYSSPARSEFDLSLLLKLSFRHLTCAVTAALLMIRKNRRPRLTNNTYSTFASWNPFYYTTGIHNLNFVA